MHELGRRCVALALAAILIATPTLSVPQPLGMVLFAESATLARAQAQAGTNIFAGDRASTARNGHLQMKLGGAQVFLGRESEASFEQNEGRATVHLARGRAGFSAQGQDVILLSAAGAWVRPQTAGLTRADVQITGAYEFVVHAKDGPVEVILENEMVVVPQNQSARVSVMPKDDDQDKEVEGPGKDKVRRKRRMAAVIFFGVTAVIVVPILLKNAVSPHIIP